VGATSARTLSNAIVIGAGIAGLTAARVLASRCERVVVLDRDTLTDTTRPRRGAPQGAHPHTILEAGRRVLNDLFAGLDGELVEAGAHLFESGTNMLFYRFGAVWPFASTGVQLLTLSRPLLESRIRRRVAGEVNVVIRDATAVSQLVGDRSSVRGVVLDTGETIDADLVVDCSGRGSRSDRWLTELGCPTPTTTEVKVGIGYATRVFRRKPGDLPTGRALAVFPVAPDETRYGLVLPVEDERWQVLLAGWHGDHPAADPAGFRAFAHTLPYPGVVDLIDAGEPLGDIATYRFPTNRRRHVEQLRRSPAGFVILGDALASFNPVYGQGITVATLQAQELGRHLDEHGCASAKMVRAFHQAAARTASVPWRFAVGADFGYPATSGVKPVGVTLTNRYANRIQRAAMASVEVRRTFVAVQHLLAPSSRLLTPAMVAKVLKMSRHAGR
jgi:2-polyprenyl-6-methoxyphenol hydroxylase-like FAD-dependent oxidoreductase